MNSDQAMSNSQSMDFFGAQDRAKANTFKLIILFVIALLVLCLGMFALVDVIYVNVKKEPEQVLGLRDYLNLDIFIFSVLGTLGLVGMATLFKVASLSGGGEKVANMLGGRKISPGTTDPDERKVLNVVEEMAIASGVPTPDVYLMPEDSINAFAAGTTMENAVIGVTRGCIRLLTRDELQGVIAHEYSHILNQDMKLNIRLMGVVFGIMVIAIIGRYLMEIAARSGRGSSEDNKGALGFLLVGLGIFILGSAGLFFSRWIKSSISRQREYLADASAVQFTRNPEGIAGALKKIGGLHEGSSVKSPAAEEASHMFFGNALKSSFIFATHPPLQDRIRRIDPSFDGKFAPVVIPSPADSNRDKAREFKKKRENLKNKGAGAGAIPTPPIPIPGTENLPGADIPLPGGVIVGSAILAEEDAQKMAQSARNAQSTVGNPNRLQLDYASDLVRLIPEDLHNAIHHPMTAMATLMALLIDRDDESIRNNQLDYLDANGPRGIVHEVTSILDSIKSLDHRYLLPLAELAAPALRDLSPNQYSDFKKLSRHLIEADQSIDLFEYTLDRMIESSLDGYFGLTARTTVEFYSINGVVPEVETILACLAYNGHDKTSEAQKAYSLGIQSLDNFKAGNPTIPDKAHCGLPALDKAIDKIRRCSGPVKKSVVSAIGKTIAADGKITRIEAELMRSVCYGFGCPVPPFVG